ncbi:MAG: hypothetical protein JSU07_06825 [Bacteroidetes bacterium]|nr:hypothetical protein [Bacteroidota bacterium]
MKKLAFSFMFLWCFTNNIAQDIKQGLIIIHVVPESVKTDYKQKIFNYHFLNGVYTGRDELLTVNGKKDGRDLIRTDLGINQVYKNRYLITAIGNIIDLKEKKVLFDGRAKLVRCSNDSAIYYTNDAFKGKFYSVYNFKTNTYGEVKSLIFRPKIGQDVEFDKSTAPFKLNLYPPNKPKIILLSDAGNPQFNASEIKNPDPLFWWIDNSTLIYSYLNKENTELSFFKINVDTKQNTLLGKIAVKPESALLKQEQLSRNEFMIYYGNKFFLLNIDNNSLTNLEFSPKSNGFNFECKYNSYGRMIKLNDKECGKYHFQPKNFKTSKNIAALVKEILVGTDSYQQGMAVWDNNKQEWRKVDCDDVLSLVGFIEE